MNEALLAKLVEQSRKYVDSLPYGVNRENEHIWKLSELIVRECAVIATMNQHEWESAGTYVLKHFGIENEKT